MRKKKYQKWDLDKRNGQKENEITEKGRNENFRVQKYLNAISMKRSYGIFIF